MLERLAIVFLAAAVVGLAWHAISRWQLARRASAALALPGYQPGKAAVLYFTSPGCGPCLAVQRPALEQVARAFGGMLQVIEVNAERHPDLADAWGVLAVPTTFVIDSNGRPRGVNSGVASAARLLAQLKAMGAEPDRPRQWVEIPSGPKPDATGEELS
jgi:thiol-disulfide isomerase/thioredoxin